MPMFCLVNRGGHLIRGNYGLGLLKVVKHAVKPEVKSVRENDPKMNEGK